MANVSALAAPGGPEGACSAGDGHAGTSTAKEDSTNSRSPAQLPPLAFSAVSQQSYVVTEDGALLTTTAEPRDRPALCSDQVMSSGQSCVEVTVVRNGHSLIVGVGRPTLDPNMTDVDRSPDFWGVHSQGYLCHDDSTDGYLCAGVGVLLRYQYRTGDVLHLLLDSDTGTLTLKKNGTLIGPVVASGLTGDLCWVVACWATPSAAPTSVRIKTLDPTQF